MNKNIQVSYANYRPLDLPVFQDYAAKSDVKEASLMKAIASENSHLISVFLLI